MSPQSRRKSVSKKDDSPGIQLDLDGRSYVVRESDISPHDIRALRKETGFSWAGLGRELAKDPDLDLIAALVWLARRIAGDEVTYDSILDDLSYDSDLNVSVAGGTKAAGGDDSPEA